MFTDAESTSAQEFANATGCALRLDCCVNWRDFFTHRHSPYQRQVAPEVVERRSSSFQLSLTTQRPPRQQISCQRQWTGCQSMNHAFDYQQAQGVETLGAACLMASSKELIGRTLPLWFRQKSSQSDLSLIDCRSEFRSIISSETRKMFVQAPPESSPRQKRATRGERENINEWTRP